MTTGTTGDPVEGRLKAALADLRPVDGAPASLRWRVDAIPDRIDDVGRLSRLRRAFSTPAAFATLLALAAIAIVAVSFRPNIVPPLSGGAPEPSFDPALEGPGLLYGQIPTMQVVQVLAVVVALALAYRWRSFGGFASWRDMGRGLGLIVLVTAPTALALQPGLIAEGAYGTALGYGQPFTGPFGSSLPTVYYETAEPGAPMIAFMELENVGPLPITLNGLVSPVPPGSSGPAWIALALPSVANTFPNTVEQLRPFTVQVMGPGEFVTLYLVGRAGSCAFGPGFEPGGSPGVTTFAELARDVEIGYSVLGLASKTTIEMPMEFVEPTGRCP
jgi:hypothetical protein